MTTSKWRNLLRSVITLSKQSTPGYTPPSHSLLNRCNVTFLYRTFTSNVKQDPNFKPKLLKPFLFTLGVSAASFSACAVIQYERAKQDSIIGGMWERMKQRRTRKAFFFREKMKVWWDSLAESNKIAFGLISINVAVFTFWQLPACRPFMTKWFTTSPANRRTSCLILSCFSHSDVMHLGANMFVLWSFMPLIHSIMGTEQFAAFYISGGCASSLISYYFKIATRSAVPSVGASGALLAVLAACCIKEPDIRLSIIFLPFFSFSAKTALFGIITLDICGILFKWKLFDHACHLGGTLFGSWYITNGHSYTWDKRAPVIQKWHEFRKWLDNR